MGFTLVEALQTAAEEQFSGMLELADPQHAVGSIALHEGRIVHASAPPLKARHAVLDLLAQPGLQVEWKDHAPCPGTHCQIGVDEILFEFTQLEDLCPDPAMLRHHVRTDVGRAGLEKRQTVCVPDFLKHRFILRVEDESGPAEFELSLGDQTIGTDPSCDIILASRGVSRRHARIRLHRGILTLEDLASRNGTFHHSSLVTVATIQPGDPLVFGDVPAVIHTRPRNELARKTQVATHT